MARRKLTGSHPKKKNNDDGFYIKKQEQTLFKRSAAGIDQVLIDWQVSFTAARKKKFKKISKRNKMNSHEKTVRGWVDWKGERIMMMV